ncbi:MAG: 5-oxoprolinase subunit PxpA [Cardiobacteriaceae bacterium]|nr:5-oxoprolinase subunit PxpA [Cardiobacteriaceae bacterium]
MSLSVDLNVDLAEGFGFDEALLQLVSSANVSCGIHAGDALSMQSALRWAKQYNVRVGAHPSFPDRENFGRTPMHLPPESLQAYLRYQLGAIKALCEAEGVALRYVKPHGALYNQAAQDEALADLIAQTVKAFDPQCALMGLSGSALIRSAEKIGLASISEVFADRRYHADGSLVSRTQLNAMVGSDEEAVLQVLQMVERGVVESVEGTEVSVKAESVCLHGDNEHALAFALRIQSALRERGILVRSGE